MDLHRVAMGYKRGSHKMAERFAQEAQKRIAEVDTQSVSAELVEALSKCTELLAQKTLASNPSPILFYSVYFQNEALKHKE